MARRSGTRDGAVAGSLTRLDERNSPRVVGLGIPAVERDLWPLLRLPWLARDAVDRHRACAQRGLHTVLCQRTRGVGGKSQTAARREPASSRPAVEHLQA